MPEGIDRNETDLRLVLDGERLVLLVYRDERQVLKHPEGKRVACGFAVIVGHADYAAEVVCRRARHEELYRDVGDALCGRVDLLFLVEGEHGAVGAAPVNLCDGAVLVACAYGNVCVGIDLVAVVVTFLLYANGGRVGDYVHEERVLLVFGIGVGYFDNQFFLARSAPGNFAFRRVVCRAGSPAVTCPGKGECLDVGIAVVAECE